MGSRHGRNGTVVVGATTARLATKFEQKAMGDPTKKTWGLGRNGYSQGGSSGMRAGSALCVDRKEGRSLARRGSSK